MSKSKNSHQSAYPPTDPERPLPDYLASHLARMTLGIHAATTDEAESAFSTSHPTETLMKRRPSPHGPRQYKKRAERAAQPSRALPLPPMPPLLPPPPRIARPTFPCFVCLETTLEDFAAIVNDCKHVFCRDCVTSHIISKLEEGRFPIICPACSIDASRPNPGAVDEVLMQQLGMSPEHYDLWVNLGIMQHSVLVDCPKCQQSFFIDREDHRLVQVITCPQPHCDGRWCKFCPQRLDTPLGVHSCDGSAELNQYIQMGSLKRCPGCDIPTEKSEGLITRRAPLPDVTLTFVTSVVR